MILCKLNALLRPVGMKLKAILILLLFFIATTTYGQSCGGGTVAFHIFNNSGLIEIKDYSVSLYVVSEDQSWQSKDFSNFGWKRQYEFRLWRKRDKRLPKFSNAKAIFN